MSDTSALRLVRFMDNPPPDAVFFHSMGWSEGTSGSRVHLECGACGAQFWWPLDKANRWLPNRQHLNFCPGCGKPIAGAEIPQCGKSHSVAGPGGGHFNCILPANHPSTQDHDDGAGRKWIETSRGTATTALYR